MSHKYFDELNIEGSRVCLFNTDEKETEIVDGEYTSTETERQKRFDEERKIYGFDSRETWSLDYTAATWLHSHLKMFLDLGGKIVDLTFYKFDIPVLKDNPDYNAADIESRPYIRETANVTEEEAIKIMISYLEDYIRDDFTDREIQKARVAFEIFSIALPTMWW